MKTMLLVTNRRTKVSYLNKLPKLKLIICLNRHWIIQDSTYNKTAKKSIKKKKKIKTSIGHLGIPYRLSLLRALISSLKLPCTIYLTNIVAMPTLKIYLLYCSISFNFQVLWDDQLNLSDGSLGIGTHTHYGKWESNSRPLQLKFIFFNNIYTPS